MFNQVYVCCPGDAVTGGPELLHQFVNELRTQGVNAFILYMPFDRKFEVPSQYKHYNTPIADFESVDVSNSVVVIPEVCTSLIKNFKNAHIAIWWLSVDNYIGSDGENPTKDYLAHLLRVFLFKKLKVSSMANFSHFVQSEYARLFLLGKGIKSSFLTDYLNETHLKKDNLTNLVIREDIIAYNPKKGRSFTQKIMSENPSLKFVPIQNMSASEVKNLLQRSKIYIDFGHHPGKDRFPREAAMAGCCIITGKRGSANNSIDISIPEQYKIKGKGLSKSFFTIANDIFSNFDSHYKLFDSYRNNIMKEPEVFKEQVALFLSKLKIEKI